MYDEKLNKVKTVPYKNNYGYFFTSGPNTWHGMEKKEDVYKLTMFHLKLTGKLDPKVLGLLLL